LKIGEKIKFERKKRKISQQELADHLNISRQAISRWENNISLPDLDTLVLVSKYFEINLNVFVEDDHNNKSITNEEIVKKMTPYILVLTAIFTLVILLPSKIKIPILFFGMVFIIFFISCILIYYIVKNFLNHN